DVVIDVVVLVVGVEVDLVLIRLVFVLIRFVEVVVVEFVILGADKRLADGVGLQFGDVLGGLLLFGFAVDVFVFVFTVRRSHRLEHRVLTSGMGRHLRDRDFVGPAALLT